jgi:hypothetical protein
VSGSKVVSEPLLIRPVFLAKFPRRFNMGKDGLEHAAMELCGVTMGGRFLVRAKAHTLAFFYLIYAQETENFGKDWLRKHSFCHP